MKSTLDLLTQNRNQLFPAYYLHPSQMINLNYEAISKWVSHFYSKLTGVNYKMIENCPDILFLKPDSSGRYKVEQFSEVYRFQEMAPLNGKHKFCVVFPVNEISNIIFNKLLKVLEEPHNGLIFLLFDQKKTNLLKTISSRVLELRLTDSDLNLMGVQKGNLELEQQFQQLISYLPTKVNQGNWDQFLKDYSERKIDEKLLLGEFTRWIASQTKIPHALLEKFPNLMQWLEISKNYHNPISERAFFLFQYASAFSKSL